MVERKAAQMSQQTRGPYSATENKEKAAQGTGLSAAVVSKKKKKRSALASNVQTICVCFQTMFLLAQHVYTLSCKPTYFFLASAVWRFLAQHKFM